MATPNYKYSGVCYTATASQTTFALTTSGGESIGYLKPEHIFVKSSADNGDNWTGLAFNTDWVFADPATSIVLTSGAAAGTLIDIHRVTPMDEDWIDFQAGSLLTAAHLNEFETWQLYIDQEIADSVGNITAGGIGLNSTDDLVEGVTNLYYTDARVEAYVSGAGYIKDAGVTKIVAGNNVTISPAGGTGEVTINSTPVSAFNYKGVIDATTQTPPTPALGDFWINSTDGTVVAGWAGAAGEAINANDRLFYNSSNTWDIIPNAGGGSDLIWQRSGSDISPVNSGDDLVIDGNVGINTTSAAARLDVRTDEIALNVGSAGSNGLITFNNEGKSGMKVEVIQGDDFTEKQDLMLQTYGGNVGIGVAATGARLDVYSKSRASISDSQYIELEAVGGAGYIRASNSTSNPSIIFLQRAGGTDTVTEAMRIDSAGRLGIGVNSPAQKLDVAGIIQTSGGIKFSDGTLQTTAATGGGGGGFWTQDGAALVPVTRTNDVAIGQAAALLTLGDAVALLPDDESRKFKQQIERLDLSQAWGGDAVTYPSGTSQELKDAIVRATTVGTVNLNADGTANFASRVGIGTTSPSTILHINSSAAIQFSITNPGGANAYSILNDGTNTIFDGSGPLWHRTSGIQPHIFSSNAGATELMRIDGATGNVGIGTAAPKSLLEVKKIVPGGIGGQILISNNSEDVDTQCELAFSPGGSEARTAYIRAGNATGSTRTDLRFGTAVGGQQAVERVRITDEGNVGIGTTDPNAALNVYRADWADFTVNNGTANVRVVAYQNDAFIGTNTNSSVYFQTNDASRFLCDTAGNFSFNRAIGVGGGILDSATESGTFIDETGTVIVSRNGNIALGLNRRSSAGSIMLFNFNGVGKGSFYIDANTLLYYGQLGTQLFLAPSVTRQSVEPTLKRGTVLSCVDLEQPFITRNGTTAPCSEVSRIDGDRCCSGVFAGWGEDEDGNKQEEMNVATQGLGVIRISAGVVVQRGDLLQSAGDGTARAQDDDVIRSRTIAKALSSRAEETYEDGSYLVRCQLMVV